MNSYALRGSLDTKTNQKSQGCKTIDLKMNRVSGIN